MALWVLRGGGRGVGSTRRGLREKMAPGPAGGGGDSASRRRGPRAGGRPVRAGAQTWGRHWTRRRPAVLPAPPPTVRFLPGTLRQHLLRGPVPASHQGPGVLPSELVTRFLPGRPGLRLDCFMVRYEKSTVYWKNLLKKLGCTGICGWQGWMAGPPERPGVPPGSPEHTMRALVREPGGLGPRSPVPPYRDSPSEPRFSPP